MFSKDWPTAPLLMRAGHLHKCFVIINITQCPITGTETGPRSFVLVPWSWFMCCFGPSLLDPWLLVQCLGTGCGRSGQATKELRVFRKMLHLLLYHVCGAVTNPIYILYYLYFISAHHSVIEI